MRRSKKILIAISITLLTSLVMGLLILKIELESVLEQSVKIDYQEVKVERFHNLDFSANWDVSLIQGREHKVEWAFEGREIKPTFININSTLFLSFDTVENVVGKAKITVPKLRKLQLGAGSILRLESFETDTLEIILDQRAKYVSNESKVKFVNIKTKGESEIQLIKDPMN